MDSTIIIFSAEWWRTSGVTAGLVVLLLAAVRPLGPRRRKALEGFLGWTLICWLVFPPLIHACTGHWRLHYGLPLQWCDFTAGVAGLALLTRRQLPFELSLFWGVTGAAAALLTPNFTQGTSWFFVLEFYVSHCLLMSAPLLLVFHGGMRPRRWSWLEALAWLNAAALAVGAIDLVIGANYMFLLEAPAGELFLYRIDWPYYLLGFELGCLASFLLIHLAAGEPRRKVVEAVTASRVASARSQGVRT